jgi:hypothetical protein
MKEKWTKRRTKIEAWQRNSSAKIIKSDLDAIRTKFDQEHERLKKTIADGMTPKFEPVFMRVLGALAGSFLSLGLCL